MSSGLEQLDMWLTMSFTPFIALLDSDSPIVSPMDGRTLSYDWLLAACAQTCAQRADLGLPLTNNEQLRKDIWPVAQNVISAGKPVLDAIAPLTPPEDIRVAHEQVVSCLRLRINFLRDIVTLIETYNFPQSTGESTCDTFDASLAIIQDFVESTSAP